MLLFISLGAVTIVCTTAQCATMPTPVLTGMVIAGVVELVYEIKGLVKIYRNKSDD